MSQTLVRRLGIDVPDEYVGRLLLWDVIPWGRRDLAFSIVVPREYEAATDVALDPQLKPGEWQRLCSFESIGLPRETLDVAVCRPFGVNLVDLAVYDVKRIGLSPYALGKLDIGNRTVVEVETRYDDAGSLWSVRSLYYPNAGRVYRISLVLEAFNAPTRDGDWDAIMQSFRCLQASSDPHLESVETYRGRGGADLIFLHPQRWQLVENEPSATERRVAMTLRQQEALRCRLLITAHSRDADDRSPEELVALALEEIGTREGILLDDEPVDSEPMQAPPPVFEPHAVYACYEGRREGAFVEVRILAMQTRRCGYTLAAVLPVEEADPFGWMYGKHAFELAAMTLNRPSEILPYNLELEAAPELAAMAVAEETSDRQDLAAILAATAKAHGQRVAEEFREAAAAAKPTPIRKEADGSAHPSRKALDEREAQELRAQPARKKAAGSAAERLKGKADLPAAKPAPAAKTKASAELTDHIAEFGRDRRDQGKKPRK